MRIVVLGGSGHIGRIIASSLRDLPDVRVHCAQRTVRSDNDIAIDLHSPNTWQPLRSYDVWINCTDTYRVPPDELYRFALESNVLLLETTAETDAYRRMRQLCHESTSTRATLVPGIGVFPGWSQLLVAHWLEHHWLEQSGDSEEGHPGERQPSVQLELRWSILSEAGSGTCEVMTRALRDPRRISRRENDQIKEETLPPLGGPHRTHLRGAPWGLELGLPEAYLIPQSLPVARCRTIAAVRPHLPYLISQLNVSLARSGLFRFPGISSLLGAGFRLARSYALKGRTTPLEMVVKGSEPTSPHYQLTFEDAFQAAGALVAAYLNRYSGEATRQYGWSPIEGSTSLNEMLQAAESLGFSVPSLALTPSDDK